MTATSTALTATSTFTLTPLQEDIVLSLIFMFLGAGLGILIDTIRTRRKFKQELQSNNSIDVSGDDWFAAWHTSVELEVNYNTEPISMVQKGNTVKMKNLLKAEENPKGGYLWQAQLQFTHGKTLMGWYFPLKEENITSKGIMFLTYQSSKKIFWGKWVGSSYDGDLSNGFVVISKNKENSLTRLTQLVAKHTDKVNIIYDAL